MSTWTAIVGAIEMDDIFPLLTGQSISDQVTKIKSILGPQWFYSDTSEKENCTLPSGSEGSLHYNISVMETERNPNGSQNKTVMITFSGHLRDFDESDAIDILEPWFQNIIEQLNYRSYSLSYRTEHGETRTISHVI